MGPAGCRHSGELKGWEPGLGAGLAKEPVPKVQSDPHLRKPVLGLKDNRERRQIQQQEDPLGELSCTHLKLFSRTVSHNGEHGGNFSGPPPALPHTRSPVGRGSGSVVMNQGWSHGGHFRKLHFYFYNSLKQTCFIFKHHSLCTTEYNLKVPEGSGQTWGPRRDS